MKVTLISHTPNPEQTIAAAARLCYSGATIDQLMQKMDEAASQRMVSMLLDMGHESPVEHVSFTFGIEGVSRSLLAQITRHRIASFSVQSQRYVSEDGFEYVTPPEIAQIPEALEIYDSFMKKADEDYNRLTELLYNKYTADVDDEAKKKQLRKKAIEDARFVLPNACTTKMMLTMNARSLYNFFAHRCCYRAQWEIRDLANQMLELVREIAPTLFKYAGAPCEKGPCNQGKMSCGMTMPQRRKNGLI